MPFTLELDDAQHTVAEVFGRFFTSECTPETVRSAEPLGYSPQLWSQLAELGAPGMGVAEEHGGGGASMLELALVAQAAGAVVAPVPFVDHVVAARRFPERSVVDGDDIAALALHPAEDSTWSMVPAGAVADVVIGLDGDELVAVRSAPTGHALSNHADAPVADRGVRDQRAVIGGRTDFERARTEWKILTAAALTGLARAALRLGTEYAKDRHQFGRPIGGFQAVQHGLADCVAPVEGATLLARKAAWALDAGRDGHLDWEHNDVEDPAALGSMAFAFATEVAALCTKRALQYHGAYGFSREYDIQLYYRRARGWPLLLGSAARERARLADRLWPGDAA